MREPTAEQAESPSEIRRVAAQMRPSDIIRVIEDLAGASQMNDVANIVRHATRKLLSADGATFILRQEDDCVYVDEDAVAPLWKGHRFPMNACVSGWAMLHRQTVVIPDIYEDPRVPQEAYKSTFVRSMAMAPIRSLDPVGAIGVYWRHVYRASAAETETLEILARAAATSIENVRLIDALSRALSEAELARDELRHRVKNAYAAAQALAALTLPREHAHALSVRLTALARAHDLLDRELAEKATIDLRELVATELEPYGGQVNDRIQLEGSPVHIDGARAVAIGLVVNELATNALKYGALSKPEGRLSVRWHVEAGWLSLGWTERDGPEVKAAAIESFGSRLLRRLVEQQLRGRLERRFEAGGVECLIEVPL